MRADIKKKCHYKTSKRDPVNTNGITFLPQVTCKRPWDVQYYEQGNLKFPYQKVLATPKRALRSHSVSSTSFLTPIHLEMPTRMFREFPNQRPGRSSSKSMSVSISLTPCSDTSSDCCRLSRWLRI